MESARGQEMKKCPCGCGKPVDGPGKIYFTTAHKTRHRTYLICTLQLPVKKWFVCEVCRDDIPVLEHEYDKPRICRQYIKPECNAEMARAARDAKQVPPHPCEYCGKLHTRQSKYCKKSCRVQKSRDKIAAAAPVRIVKNFNRSECCKRIGEDGWTVFCGKYLGNLEHNFKQCPRRDCFVWPQGRKAA